MLMPQKGDAWYEPWKVQVKWQDWGRKDPLHIMSRMWIVNQMRRSPAAKQMDEAEHCGWGRRCEGDSRDEITQQTYVTLMTASTLYVERSFEEARHGQIDILEKLFWISVENKLEQMMLEKEKRGWRRLQCFRENPGNLGDNCSNGGRQERTGTRHWRHGIGWEYSRVTRERERGL